MRLGFTHHLGKAIIGKSGELVAFHRVDILQPDAGDEAELHRDPVFVHRLDALVAHLEQRFHDIRAKFRALAASRHAIAVEPCYFGNHEGFLDRDAVIAFGIECRHVVLPLWPLAAIVGGWSGPGKRP
jgi:hypothetical protein